MVSFYLFKMSTSPSLFARPELSAICAARIPPAAGAALFPEGTVSGESKSPSLVSSHMIIRLSGQALYFFHWSALQSVEAGEFLEKWKSSFCDWSLKTKNFFPKMFTRLRRLNTRNVHFIKQFPAKIGHNFVLCCVSGFPHHVFWFFFAREINETSQTKFCFSYPNKYFPKNFTRPHRSRRRKAHPGLFFLHLFRGSDA